MADRTEEQQAQIDYAKRRLAIDVAGAEEPLWQMIWTIWEARKIPNGISELGEYFAQLLADHARAAATWPQDTINARLDAAFAELDTIGIMGLHHATSTMSGGWTAAWEESEFRDPPPRGVVFYHEQDLEPALAGRGMYLAYGSLEEPSTDDDALAIGREVFAMLEKHGIPVEWSEHVRARIKLAPFPWQRRRHDGLTTLTADEIRSLADQPNPPEPPEPPRPRKRARTPEPITPCRCGAMQLVEWIDESTGEVLNRCERCEDIVRT